MVRAHLIATPFEGPLGQRLALPQLPQPIVYWLGQAGFIVTTPRHRIIIDPYLSDSLARKYHGTVTPHERMMPAPAATNELGAIDLVLCTHHHTDHMDGETLKPLAEHNPHLRFVVPRSATTLACKRIGVGVDRLIPLDADERVQALPGIAIQALRAAHETLEKDDDGHYRFLGYCIEINGLRIFHSGDTVPFPGQIDEIRAIGPHLALLPVNGRSERLRAIGIAGNLTVEEAIELCADCAIPSMIAHHYGLFAFNTADPEEIDRAAANTPLQVIRARLQMEYTLRPV